MDNLTKALFIKRVFGVIFAVIGYISFFVDADLADFMSGAMSGILFGFCLLDLLIAPRETKEK